VYYYTAGIRQYGLTILDVFRAEIKRRYSQENPNVLETMKDVFSHTKMIGRDDHSRFESFHGMTEHERFELEYIKLNKDALEREQFDFGGDSTLNLKNFTKSLSNLAGGDDSIFAIIDDRFDVWLQEIKNTQGQVIDRRPVPNLVQIPPYFYWEKLGGFDLYPDEPYKKLILEIGREYELDLSLLTHLKFLDRVHE
jgi:hypothetical protein